MTVYTRTHAPNKPQATLASDYITTVGCMLGRILMQFKLFELSTSLHAQLATSICTCGIKSEEYNVMIVLVLVYVQPTSIGMMQPDLKSICASKLTNCSNYETYGGQTMHAYINQHMDFMDINFSTKGIAFSVL